MPSGSGAFGVQVGDLTTAAGRYQYWGDHVADLARRTVPSVGEDSLGHLDAFRAFAGPYRQAFQQFHDNLAALGGKAGKVSEQLRHVADDYERTERSNRRRSAEVS
ncbi:MAG TPA: hypothetical protein VGX25_33380 [Actinophytocola sp.]|uniref:hypothetical protein n=1 Tax=Actinophytocola sp. TaxID=1872138 RepID=UPI002DDCE39A|nr:hypothetical protein [Actinophytocola sp.]HEV2784305.1 hypothetical protein [Actinophytocola sp.]